MQDVTQLTSEHSRDDAVDPLPPSESSGTASLDHVIEAFVESLLDRVVAQVRACYQGLGAVLETKNIKTPAK